MRRLVWLGLGAGAALVVARAMLPGGPAAPPGQGRPSVGLASFLADGITAHSNGVTLRGSRLRPAYRRLAGARVGPPEGLEVVQVHAAWEGPRPVEVIAASAAVHERGLRFEDCHVRVADQVVAAERALWDVEAGRLLVPRGRRPDGTRTAPTALDVSR